MRIEVTGKGIKLSDALRERIDQKLAKFNRYFDDQALATVKFKEEANHTVCSEITMKIDKHYYRAESTDQEIMTALENSISIMEGQIRKHKARIAKRIHDFKYMKPYLDETPSTANEEAPDIVFKRQKKFVVSPMTPEEAALQMEMLGHNFLLFLLPDTGKVALVYKRKDGQYGLLEPEY